ncbi:MAG: amino acid permease [Chlamydiota bacterium]
MNKTFGGILLVAGCCIGAGMLAIPVITGLSGFLPSLVMLLVVWLFMTYTGLLLLEVNLWYGENISIITMAERTLGRAGKAVAWIIYLFLFYSLMIAYIAGSGGLISGFYNYCFASSLPEWVGSLFFTLLFSFLIFLGTRHVDGFNRYLILGLVITYIALIFVGSGHVTPSFLTYKRWNIAPWVTPVLITSFGYHNLIPSLNDYLKGNAKRLRIAIIVGSAIPLIVYILWCGMVMGIIPIGGIATALQDGDIATHALRNAVGSPLIITIADFFGFFAVVTSLLGVALSFVDFMADGLSIKKTTLGKAALCGIVFIPPFIIAVTHPNVFLTAINYAGGFGAVILFWILPALMAWSGRYKKNMQLDNPLPGGKTALIIVIIAAVIVFSLEGIQEFGYSPLSQSEETLPGIEEIDIIQE